MNEVDEIGNRLPVSGFCFAFSFVIPYRFAFFDELGMPRRLYLCSLGGTRSDNQT